MASDAASQLGNPPSNANEGPTDGTKEEITRISLPVPVEEEEQSQNGGKDRGEGGYWIEK